MAPRCTDCGRRKKSYLAEYATVEIECPHCTFFRRLFGRVDPITPLPENPDAAAASEAYLNDEISLDELESRLEEALTD